MRVTADQWRRAFEAQGVRVLSVSAAQADPNTILVFLHGNSGQASTGDALDLIRLTPGVAGAVATEHAPTIIRVWLA